MAARPDPHCSAHPPHRACLKCRGHRQRGTQEPPASVPLLSSRDLGALITENAALRPILGKLFFIVWSIRVELKIQSKWGAQVSSACQTNKVLVQLKSSG